MVENRVQKRQVCRYPSHFANDMGQLTTIIRVPYGIYYVVAMFTALWLTSTIPTFTINQPLNNFFYLTHSLNISFFLSAKIECDIFRIGHKVCPIFF